MKEPYKTILAIAIVSSILASLFLFPEQIILGLVLALTLCGIFIVGVIIVKDFLP